MSRDPVVRDTVLPYPCFPVLASLVLSVTGPYPECLCRSTVRTSYGVLSRVVSVSGRGSSRTEAGTGDREIEHSEVVRGDRER